MMMTRMTWCAALAAMVMTAGCSSYRWTSHVPENRRTVAVPIFENRTPDAELGPIAAQYLLREFQREGTFKIKRTGDAAIEIQGVITASSRGAAAYDRNYGHRAAEYRYTVTAAVTIIDRVSKKVLATDRNYTAETTFLVNGDTLTSQRNAGARIAQDLARQIVDDVTSWDFKDDAATK